MSGIFGFQEVKKLIAAPEPPELGPGPRANVLAIVELNEAINDCLSGTTLPSSAQNLIRSLVLLWHDHLEPAHVIAQDIGNADGSYVHGIVHRREADYGNAKYWFRRVGKHPCYLEIANRAKQLLQSNGDRAMITKLIPHGEWDAFAFIDACESAAKRSAADAQNQLLRKIQRIEFEVLLENFCLQT